MKMIDKNTPWSKRVPFDTESITCGRCDNDISDSDFQYCPYCGQNLTGRVLEIPKHRSRWTVRLTMCSSVMMTMMINQF